MAYLCSLVSQPFVFDLWFIFMNYKQIILLQKCCQKYVLSLQPTE